MGKTKITPYNILFYHITYSLFTGGDKMVSRLCVGLDKDSWVPVLCTQTSAEIVDKTRVAGVPCIIIPWPKNS